MGVFSLFHLFVFEAGCRCCCCSLPTTMTGSSFSLGHKKVSDFNLACLPTCCLLRGSVTRSSNKKWPNCSKCCPKSTHKVLLKSACFSKQAKEFYNIWANFKRKLWHISFKKAQSGHTVSEPPQSKMAMLFWT